MKEFFGFGGYTRPAEGYMSWQHLTFVTALVLMMIALAVWLGLRNRSRSDKQKNRVLIAAAVLIDALEIFKVVIFCLRANSAWDWVYNLPLFLCSIQLITIPLAALSRGRLREASLDFVFIFGLLGAVLGTYCAGNNYAVYPVLSVDNVVSGLTHCISGFASLYVAIVGMVSMKKKNIPLTFAILLGFCTAAYIANIFTDCNYMFLSRGDGTPYDIVYNLVSGHAVLYPLLVVLLFLVYIVLFYQIYYHADRRLCRACDKKQSRADR